MRYREAFAIGTKCEGVIKCTFATIYNADGKPLFSLQTTRTTNVVEYKGGFGDETKATDMLLIPSSQDDLYFAVSKTAEQGWQGKITYRLPLVRITEISNTRLVPAMLTNEAINEIAKAMAKVRVRKYTIYQVAKATNTPGGKRVQVAVAYDLNKFQWEQWQAKENDKWYYEYEVETVTHPKYQELIDIINSKGVVYIKPDAFDWEPLDIENATVVVTTDDEEKEIRLDDALADAKRKLDQAKAILATATAVTIF